MSMNLTRPKMENTLPPDAAGSSDRVKEVMPAEYRDKNIIETITETKQLAESGAEFFPNEFLLTSESRTVSEINLRLNKCALDNDGEFLISHHTDDIGLENYLTISSGQTQLEMLDEPMAVIQLEKCEIQADEGRESLEGLTVDENIEIESNNYSGLRYEWTKEDPLLLCSATEEYRPTISCENFTKGCDWSPDGTCLLVPSEDFRIRVYELPRELYSGSVSLDMDLPPLKAALRVKEGGIIYDSCWFPSMNSWDPSTCCFASTSRESPIHLWDAFTGDLRATYRAYNQVDEVEAAISVQFINSGSELWCGFKGCLRTFDTGRPGRQVNNIHLKKDIPNVTGIVSCIRENPSMPGLVAFGSYSKSIGLYKDGPLCALKTASGVTQIEFSPCGLKLYSVVRRNNEMLCWDLRNPGVVLHSIKGRQADSNQRIQFSVSPDGNDIISGGTNGAVTVWQHEVNVDTEYQEELHMKRKFQISVDCVNGVSLHRSLPIMATSSGQRICEEEDRRRDNSVRLWWCGSTQSTFDREKCTINE